MLRLIFVFSLFLNSTFLWAHKDLVVRKQYGNVQLTTITGFAFEEIHKTMLIAQYAEMLSHELNSNLAIALTFRHEYCGGQPDETNRIQRVEGVFTIYMAAETYSFSKVLKLVEYVLKHKKSKLSQKEISEILNQPTSKEIQKVLSTKLYRPTDFDKLKPIDHYTYFVQNEHFYLVKTNEKNRVLLELGEVFQMISLPSGNLVVFENTVSFVHIIGRNYERYQILPNKSCRLFVIEEIDTGNLHLIRPVFYSEPAFEFWLKDGKIYNSNS